MNEQMVIGPQAPDNDFALGFQRDGVQLLHRSGGEWDELGKARFDGDLRESLGGFARQLRAANAPGVSLVIPEAQILYADLELPQAADTASALRAGLDGLTPYRVEELAFDYVPADAKPGSKVKIAAVWRQTLQEAEDFAVSHGFAPNRFVAAPEAGKFPHMPDFGATELAAEWALAEAELSELASELASEPDADQPQPAAPAAEAVAELQPSPVVAVPGKALSAPVLSRITPHLVAATAPAIAVAEQAAACKFRLYRAGG